MKLITTDFNSFKSDKFFKALCYLFFVSIILIPFDDLPYITVLGGLGKRASVYPFFLIIVIAFTIFVLNRKIYFQKSIENILMASFFGVTIISVLINFSAISNSIFKGQSGIKRVIIQLASITTLILIYYIIQLIIVNGRIDFRTIRKYICISFIPVGIIGIFQLINLLQIYDFTTIIENTSYLVNMSLRGSSYGVRIRGVSAEASYLGMYCSFVFPWIFSYIITEKKKSTKAIYLIISMLILGLIVGTKSRTAIILTLGAIIVIVGLIILFYKNVTAKYITTISLTILTVFLFGFSSNFENIRNSFVDSTTENSNNEYNVGNLITSISDPTIDSNIARSTMQKAAFKIGLDNPILGVGIGQFGFYCNDYINDDSKAASHEVRCWTDTTMDVWPPVHSIYHRIFAEGGIITLGIYLAFAITLCLKLLIKIIKNRNDLTSIILLSSYSTILIGGLTLDQYVIPQFWIMSAIIATSLSGNLKEIETQ